MKFIKVVARPCDSQGNERRQQLSPQESFYLNIDLIGGISETRIMLKGGNILMLGGNYFTDFNLKDKIDFENL
ncbi:hypothetical protein CLU83_1533 [Flavobacterium sp. 1]|uniref:hypothetical protein n=1 Tax=Flavobacterium sp. 1 TaxID=2035200 RepID=UPI000C23B98D|nr:hypothetical protein [Flavobacterium sp. 1]PJJ08277.1 hypothetical protein CLU83_1533 [Flavobacterium sp. 1]